MCGFFEVLGAVGLELECFGFGVGFEVLVADFDGDGFEVELLVLGFFGDFFCHCV